MKRKILSIMLLLASTILGIAQEETRYFLPRTAVKITLLTEKTTYTPGEYQPYAERFLRNSQTEAHATESYRILAASITAFGIADTTHQYTAKTDVRRNINEMNLDDNGVLLSINTAPKKQPVAAKFTAAPKPTPLNPHDYMRQEILSAGSKAKMAELTAQDIYEIRESRSLLARGQADFMPKDGDQLRTMLQQLDTQEKALRQLFEGITIKDTLEQEIIFVPEKGMEKQLLFRYSRHFGMTDIDDLAGTPYELTIEDLHTTPTIQVAAEPGKKDKNGDAIYVCLPGKIRLTLTSNGQPLASEELYAAQFGQTEMLDGNLFSKKLLTSIVLNPTNGNLESIKTEVLK